MVYTPVKGSLAGGNFYTYDTMHLTELITSYDESNFISRNADHPDVSRFAAYMVLALPYVFSQTSKISYIPSFGCLADFLLIEFFQRPIYAMLSMIHAAHIEEKEDPNVIDSEADEELSYAIGLAEVMLKEWNLDWTDIHDYVSHLPDDWTDLGPLLDLTFLGKLECITY
jgi:hypothetical protein